ncbi:NTP transferase domain-containing protein, partial [Micromonospora sp. NPDC003776]
MVVEGGSRQDGVSPGRETPSRRNPSAHGVLRARGYRGPVTAYAAVVLSGGAARRMGGVDKPARPVGGRPMLHRVLAAVADADQRLVVG